jgi:hypothetical protein
MKSSSTSLVLTSLISVVGLLACSPDSGDASSSGPGAGGGGGTPTASSGGDSTSAETSTGQGSPTVSSGGDGDGDGGSTSSDGGSTSSDGGAGPGNGGQGAGGDPSGVGGDPSGAGGDAVSSAATGSADGDNDGYTIDEGDCDDARADINPGATEICNTRDDNCDGTIDEGFDLDNDAWYACLGDCDDNNAAVNPDQTEIGPNGLDDDCDGDTDGPFIDDDGDGYTEAEGDCADDDPLVNPGAIEFEGNDVDDDCDGNTDEALEACDSGLNNTIAGDYARAIGLCNGELVSASFVSGPQAARNIMTSYGSNNAPLNRPIEGSSFVHLSCGRADTSTKDSGYAFDGSLSQGLTCTQSAHPNPLPDPGACGAADPTTVCDKTELSMQIRVPTNANSFSYDFQFYSTEYPTFRCTAFDDTFLAMVSGSLFNGNASFDNNDNVVSVNNGYFDICLDTAGNDCTINPVATLTGTGYYPFTGGQSSGAGATVPLTTAGVPVTPGETITLRFIIFDEGDDQLDSSVLIDNFRWSIDPSDGPGTEPTN